MTAAWNWLGDNSSALQVVINLGLLAVWAFYLDLFVRSHRRARKCRILIALGGRDDLQARCLISNMSTYPVYISKVIVTVIRNAERRSRAVTDRRGIGEDPPPDPEQQTRQGPLLAGQWRDIGSLVDLLDAAGGGDEIREASRRSRPWNLELTVVAIYGAEDLPFGAKRCFRVTDGHAEQVRPTTEDTQQMRSRYQRRSLHRPIDP